MSRVQSEPAPSRSCCVPLVRVCGLTSDLYDLGNVVRPDLTVPTEVIEYDVFGPSTTKPEGVIDARKSRVIYAPSARVKMGTNAYGRKTRQVVLESVSRFLQLCEPVGTDECQLLRSLVRPNACHSFASALLPTLSMPTVIRHATASLLLECGSDFLLRSESENNLILGICGDMACNPPTEDTQPWLMTIEENEAVVGIAIVMNPPRNIVITRLSAVAMTSLVEFLVDLKLVIPGAVGPSPDVAAVAEQWAQRNGLRASLSMNQKIYACERVIPPPFLPPQRQLRAAAPTERELLVAWSREFSVAVHNPESVAECTERIDRLMARRAIWVWDDNEPVSCAAFSRDSPHGVAINHVYTPPNYRGRGYAGACVAALTTRLLSSGKRFCCLYTDLANSTSNKIYQQIGYQPVCDSQIWQFE